MVKSIFLASYLAVNRLQKILICHETTLYSLAPIYLDQGRHMVVLEVTQQTDDGESHPVRPVSVRCQSAE